MSKFHQFVSPSFKEACSRSNLAALVIAGAFVLALEPAMWLVGTWYEDGYQGIGWVAGAVVAGLVGWSRTSPLTQPLKSNPYTYGLLMLTALIRLAAQILDINVLGALLLGVDVYALASISGLAQRRRALSPFWLAIVFCFSLPIEPIVQRLIGFDLQQISASVACGMLSPIFTDLSCQGVRLRIHNLDVMVDLPCSGAELMSITALVLSIVNTRRMPSVVWGVLSCFLGIGLSLLGNGVRISALAVGIVYAEQLPFNIMAPLPHSIVGLLVVMIVGGAIWQVARFYVPQKVKVKPHCSYPEGEKSVVHRIFALSFLPVALLVGVIQPQPVDAFPRLLPPSIPSSAAGFLQQSSPLSDQESGYFTRYGGGARKASFGPFGLLLVTTRSPLRHLHDPTICFSGSGYDVQFVGTNHVTKSAVYRASKSAITGQTEDFIIRVSYRSDRGQTVSSVSEAIWYWLRFPQTTWTMVQRIVPVHPSIDSSVASEWEQAMRRAYNIT